MTKNRRFLRTMTTAAMIATGLLVAVVPVSAQWLQYPTPGMPRTTEGKPILSAPTPRAINGKPDLSGIWGWTPGRYLNITADLKPDETQPWADALVKQRAENLGREDPSGPGCLPFGPRVNVNPLQLAKIIQTPQLIVVLSEDLTYRQIFLDGRPLPVDPNPSFMGYSVGHWDGDTLVVESIGFNDRTWLDIKGHPHSEALRISERIRRLDMGHLQIEETLDDSRAYTRPWTVRLTADLAPDTELLEYVCNENEQSRQHLVGTASDELKNAVTLPIATLQRYAGTYELRLGQTPTPIAVEVTLSDGKLWMNGIELIPTSETTFGGQVRVDFAVDDHGEVTHMIFHAAGSDVVGPRRLTPP